MKLTLVIRPAANNINALI